MKEAIHRGEKSVVFDVMNRKEVLALILELIHFNQYLSLLNISMRNDKKIYKKAKRRRNKEMTVQAYELTQEWLAEIKTAEFEQFYQNTLSRLLLCRLADEIVIKPEYTMEEMFHQLHKIVEREWIKSGLMTRVGSTEEEEEVKL